MGMTAQDLTRKQKALVKALADPSCKTITEAAQRAGMTREHASRLSRNVTVSSEVDRWASRQGDSARAIADKALARANRAVTSADSDPLTDVQVAMGTIGVAEKYANTFETPDSDEQRASEQAAKRVLLKRALVAGVLVAIRASRRGRSVEELRAWCREYLLALD